MYKNFENILNIRKITAYSVAKGTELSPTVFSDWKSGKSKPKVDKLIKIADYLNVTLEELVREDS